MSDVERLLDEATPLPWGHGPLLGEIWRLRGKSLFQRVAWTKGRAKAQRVRADADLIVYAVNHLPAYEAAVEALERLTNIQDPAEYSPAWDAGRAALRRLRDEVSA